MTWTARLWWLVDLIFRTVQLTILHSTVGSLALSHLDENVNIKTLLRCPAHNLAANDAKNQRIEASNHNQIEHTSRTPAEQRVHTV